MYRYRPVYMAEKEGAELLSVFPVMEVACWLTGCRGVSLPFADACPCLFRSADQVQQGLEELLEYGRARKWKYLEMRSSEGFASSIQSFRRFFVHTLDLRCPAADLFAACSTSMRRNIRKARGKGVRVERLENFDAVRRYYRLHCLTRKKHGLPPQPFSFFAKIAEHMIMRGRGSVWLASHENQDVAGAIFLHFNGNVLYKFGGSDIATSICAQIIL